MTQGLLAEIRVGGRKVKDVLIIGTGVPRIHHADRVPVYLVTQHMRGSMQTFKDKRTRIPLVAYPAAWPGPASRSGDTFIFAEHASLKWDAPVPVFEELTP